MGYYSQSVDNYLVINEFLNSPDREKNRQEFADISLLLAVDSTGINNGVWMMRNSKWANDFLERWWHSDICCNKVKRLSVGT